MERDDLYHAARPGPRNALLNAVACPTVQYCIAVGATNTGDGAASAVATAAPHGKQHSGRRPDPIRSTRGVGGEHALESCPTAAAASHRAELLGNPRGRDPSSVAAARSGKPIPIR